MPTTKKKLGRVQKLKELINGWNVLSMKHRAFGAADTEPDGVFQHCIRKSFEGEDFTMPKNASDWQLYASKKGVGRVAISLTAHLRRCIVAMGKITIDERPELNAFLDDYLWRA
jgi:hypothetical protein